MSGVTNRPYCHLHCHTHYSLLDGANRIPELAAHVKSLGMQAVAITDHGNMAGAIEFYVECEKAGVKPVIGYEAYVAPGRRTVKGEGKGKGKGRGDAAHHLTLLVRNETGYRNLIKLASEASLTGYYYVPRIDKELLKEHSEGLICLSGCASGEFSSLILQDRMAEAEELARWFHGVFGDNFYVEVQNNGLQIQRLCRDGAVDIANKLGLPLVATSDAHYLTRQDAPAHDVLLCINTGARLGDPKRMRYGNDDGVTVDQFYVCPPQEMYDRFPGMDEAVARSQTIADGVELHLNFKRRHFPVFAPPDSLTPEQYLRRLCEAGAAERYRGVTDPSPEDVRQRLEHELDIICRMGFASYFLIVWDFVRYGRDKGIPSGARGSGVGAIVSYCLYLSHVCPLANGLLFERFLDPNRAEAPDIDIDFCQARREEIISYVRDRYGEDAVAQIATYGTMLPRAALRDVGRVLDMPLGDCDKFAKMVPEKVGTTMEDALRQVPELAKAAKAPATAHWFDIATRLEGTNRNAGTHAAGIVISHGPLVNHVPLQRVTRKDGGAEVSSITTQWVMGDIEKIGLLKMDFLGLRTLTLIDNCLELIRKTRGLDIDIHHLPTGDERTYALLQAGDSQGVFQLESDGIRELLKKMKPDRLGDITAVVALYRPGPLNGGMVDAYVNRKHGREAIPQVHPTYDSILSETYGVVTYQEQIMLILHRLGGIELSSAYACIKAISKKKQDQVDKFRTAFLAGAGGRGLDAAKAEEIFDLIGQFGAYGFNKSHSVAYADLAYKTGWLKANYASEFMAALLTSDIGARDKLVGHIADARRLGIAVLPPSFNHSQVGFTVDDQDRILFGLVGVSGVGEAGKAVIAARRDGEFRSLADFCERVDMRACGKTQIEKMLKAGAGDCFLPPGGHRAQLVAALPATVASAADVQEDRAKGQRLLFDCVAAEVVVAEQPLPAVTPWSEQEALQMEKESLDIYLSGHPLTAYADLIRQVTSHSLLATHDADPTTKVVVAGVISQLRVQAASLRGGSYARFKLEDTSGMTECVMWTAAYAKAVDVIADDAVIFAIAKPDAKNSSPGLSIEEVILPDAAHRVLARGLFLRLVPDRHTPELVDKLKLMLQRYRKSKKLSPVFVRVLDKAGRRCDLRLDENCNVAMQDVRIEELEAMLGAGNVRFLGRHGPTIPFETNTEKRP